MSDSPPAMELAFLRRFYWIAWGGTAFLAILAVFAKGFSWAGHFFVIGSWMNVWAGLLAWLVLAATSTPRRHFTALTLFMIKIIWLGCLFWYCQALSPPRSAIAAGVLTLFFLFMLKTLGWAWANARPTP